MKLPMFVGRVAALVASLFKLIKAQVAYESALPRVGGYHRNRRDRHHVVRQGADWPGPITARLAHRKRQAQRRKWARRVEAHR